MPSSRFPSAIIALINKTPRGMALYALKTLAHPHYRPLMAYFGGSLTLSLMWSWDWQLVLATGMGIAAMSLVYVVPQQQWRWQEWRIWLQGLSGKMVLTVGVGGMVTLSTYLMATIWAESHNRTLAIATILQSLGTATILGLIIWQMAIAQQQKAVDSFGHKIPDLTAPDPLKRLIAVRYLSQLADRQELNEGQLQQLGEYFTLMLTQENEPTIRQALFDYLQAWQNVAGANSRSNPVLKPLKIPIGQAKTLLRRPLMD
jgi:hypothetical protein